MTAGESFTSAAVFNAQANKPYAIAVDGALGKQGTCVLNWNLEQTLDQVPTILTPPFDTTVLQGSNATFSIQTLSQPGLLYQWYLDGAAIAGATASTLTISHAQRPDLGLYTIMVVAPTGRSITSEPAELAV